MEFQKDTDFFHKPYSILFIGLNSCILMSCFFMGEVKYAMFSNLESTMSGAHLKIWRPSALAITWYKESDGIDSHFFWTSTITSLLMLHSVFLALAAIIAFVSIPYHRNFLVFSTYCLFLSMAIFIRVYVIASVLEPSSKLYTTAVHTALTELEQKYKILSNSPYVSSVNTYMINARCCGVNGPSDFVNLNLTFQGSNFLFPYNPSRGADVYFPPGNISYTFKVSRQQSRIPDKKIYRIRKFGHSNLGSFNDCIIQTAFICFFYSVY
ncbi:hypothetical protein ElyMa_000895300 [Elysia marginata]|uniref:Uncharacterized protein n=1 Tax=Elysia marginata TaxID=1093978 RepID=A0AAV4H720_9GAST|nr:hypothetical protein ElyMa_000895300 [Elysia marginata]